MVYALIFKKRFRNNLEKRLQYLESEFGLAVAQKFAQRVNKRLTTLQSHPHLGICSATIKDVRSIVVGKRNRIYYRVTAKEIIVLNIYDTRINPARNKLK